MDAVWDWVRANWGNIYMIGALVAGGLSGLAAFVVIWWFAGSKYELGGLVLGWIPGAVAGAVAALVLGFGWPIAIGVMVLFGDSLMRALDRAAGTR